MVDEVVRESNRKSAVGPRFLSLGGKLTEQCGWQQVESFVSVEQEIRSVQEGVGLSDLSPLTKIDLRMKDPVTAWPLLFPENPVLSEFGKPGYHLIQRDHIKSHPVLVARTARENFFITSLSGVAPTIEQSIRETVVGGGVSVTDVTSGYSAFELSGPSATFVLQKLMKVPSPKENGIVIQARVGGVHALIMRIDGVGVSGKPSSLLPAFRLYVSRDLGLSFWEILEDAGREFKIQPYGTIARAQLFPDIFPG